jgi:hypothetical protein
MNTPVNKIKTGLLGLPSRKRSQVEDHLSVYVEEVLDCVKRGVPRKVIRDYLVSEGIKVSVPKFKIFLEKHVLPKIPKTAAQALVEATAVAKGERP